jgi:adenylate cyclase
MRLDPRDPRGMFRWNQVVITHYYERDYAGAVAAAERMMARFPQSALPYRWLAAALGPLGRTEEAQAALTSALTLAPDLFALFVAKRLPWHREEDYAHMMEGLRKAGWGE